MLFRTSAQLPIECVISNSIATAKEGNGFSGNDFVKLFSETGKGIAVIKLGNGPH